MAAQPEETPDFDFEAEAEAFFDHARVADEVIKPLVSYRLPIDWDESAMSDQLGIQLRGEYQGVVYDASVQARNQVFEVGEGIFDSVPVLSIGIEELVTDERRDLIAGRVAESGMKFDRSDDDALERFMFKMVRAYVFYGPGNIHVETCQALEDLSGSLMWTSKFIRQGMFVLPNLDNILEGDEDSHVLQEHDMDQIEAGIYVLRAPEAIIAALEAIRAEPIT